MATKTVKSAPAPVVEPTKAETQEQRDMPFQKRLSAMLQAEHKARIKWHAGGHRPVPGAKPKA